MQRFIQRLNEREDVQLYRLPIEAEWEYAVRAGNGTSYHFGDNQKQLREHAWYSFNSENSTWPSAGSMPIRTGCTTCTETSGK